MRQKHIMVLLAGFLLLGALSAQEGHQESKEERRARKKQEKVEKQEAGKVLFQQSASAIEDRAFSLRATRVYDRKGNGKDVNETTNFIQVEGEDVTVQLAFPFATGGPNGIGGITLDGRITNMEVSETKKGNQKVLLNVFGTGLSAEITITVYKGGNRSEAWVSSNTMPTKVRYTGHLRPLAEAGTYKGRSLF